MAVRHIIRLCPKSFHLKSLSQQLPLCSHFTIFHAILKYDKEAIEIRKIWNHENLILYGPLLKTSKTDKDSAPKKRGRPKKIQDDTDAETLPKRNKGRPKKVKEEQLDAIDSETTPMKRGLPKKKKEHKNYETESNTNVDVQVQTEPQTAKSVGIQTDPEGTQTDYADNVSQNQLNKTDEISKKKSDSVPEQSLSYLNDILLFPLFPPDRREYYINPPSLPDIHIPGYTDRAMYDNPYFPSVGTILSATMPVESRMALKRWRDNLVKELGEEGFKQHKKEILDRGSNFHTAVQNYLEGAALSDIPITTGNEGHWESAQGALKDIHNVQTVEAGVIHRHLCYKGIYDCVGVYRDDDVLIDWKTSKKSKADIRYTYDNPLQVAAYLGAYNFTKDRSNMVDKTLIVVCYEDGQPAHTHLMSRQMCIEYWNTWLNRLHQYWREKLSTD